jgi:hypothetical protein
MRYGLKQYAHITRKKSPAVELDPSAPRMPYVGKIFCLKYHFRPRPQDLDGLFSTDIFTLSFL